MAGKARILRPFGRPPGAEKECQDWRDWRRGVHSLRTFFSLPFARWHGAVATGERRVAARRRRSITLLLSTQLWAEEGRVPERSLIPPEFGIPAPSGVPAGTMALGERDPRHGGAYGRPRTPLRATRVRERHAAAAPDGPPLSADHEENLAPGDDPGPGHEAT